MNKPKIKNSNLLEKHLWEGEEILWQGRPNAPLWEYLQKKADFADYVSSKNLIDHPLIEQDRKWARLSCGFLMVLWAFLSLVVCGVSFYIFNTFASAFALFPTVLISLGASRVLLDILPKFVSWLNGLLEMRYVVYAITNKRIYVALRWSSLYLMLDEVISYTLETGEYGTNISWQHRSDLGRIQERFPLFLGLNDFDCKGVTELAQEYRNKITGNPAYILPKIDNRYKSKKSKQKIKNSNLLEDHLWEGEEILWQGRPNAPLWEYLLKKPLLLEPEFKDKRGNRRETFDSGLLDNAIRPLISLIILFLSLALSFFCFTLLANFGISFIFREFSAWIPEGDWAMNSVAIVLLVVSLFLFLLIIVLMVRLGQFIYLVIETFFKLVMGLIEKTQVRYVLTNRCVYLYLYKKWLFLEYPNIRSIAIEAGQYGKHLNWKHDFLGRSQVIFPPFLGLNDFDVEQIIKIVQEQELFGRPEITIEDKREKAKQV